MNTIFISENCNPQTIDVVKTRAEPFGLKVIIDKDQNIKKIDTDLLCAIFQYPTTYGQIENVDQYINHTHDKKGKAIIVTDLLALTCLKPPGEMDADIVVGNSQRFGVPMG